MTSNKSLLFVVLVFGEAFVRAISTHLELQMFMYIYQKWIVLVIYLLNLVSDLVSVFLFYDIRCYLVFMLSSNDHETLR